jgi:aryl-alcohol dehydrogenase-like predicted oxidoreductase
MILHTSIKNLRILYATDFEFAHSRHDANSVQCGYAAISCATLATNQRNSMERRHFLKQAAAAAAAAGLKTASGQNAGTASDLQGGTAFSSLPMSSVVNGIGRRKLGLSDAEVSIIGVGGYHLGLAHVQEQDAISIIRRALDEGINFLDNCWDYNAGVSEERMGKALQDGYRQKAFLMTKIDGRTGPEARKQIDESLRRLKTDTLDLLQIHEVIRMGDAEQVFQPGNVIDVLQQARKEGKIRFIGFTGHKSPEIHLNMIEAADRHHFQFDTVQMPVNALDDHFDSFGRRVIPVARKHNIAILGMKSLSNGAILKTNTVTAVEALHYAMSVPVTMTVCGCESMANLEEKLRVARDFKPMSAEQKIAVLRKTAPFGGDGKYEDYKNSHIYDGTVHNPQWLG